MRGVSFLFEMRVGGHQPPISQNRYKVTKKNAHLQIFREENSVKLIFLRQVASYARIKGAAGVKKEIA